MFEPEEQQLAICLLKTDLGEIENTLVHQRAALSELENDYQQQNRKTIAALKVVRLLNTEKERMKQENGRCVAKRMEAKRQCEVLSETLKMAQDDQNYLKTHLIHEENEEEAIICRYEDSLRELSDKFRNAAMLTNQAVMFDKINKTELLNKSLEAKREELQRMVNQLRTKLEKADRSVPEDILDILGKSALNNFMQENSFP